MMKAKILHNKQEVPSVFYNSQVKFLTKQNVCELCQVSQRTVDNWIKGKVIPSIKIGRLIRFRGSEVEAALLRYERKSIR